MYADISHRTNVISGTPPSKKMVQDFILVADKNFDGVLSFDECEVVALLLCEHCAFQISAYWLLTNFVTPFIAFGCFHAVYVGVEMGNIYINSFFEFVRAAVPVWLQFLLDEKLIFLFFVPLLNYCCVPSFLKIWGSIFRDTQIKLSSSGRRGSGRSNISRLPMGITSSVTPLDTPRAPLDPPSGTLSPKGKKKASIYDIYDAETSHSAPTSRCSTPTISSSVHPNSPSSPRTTAESPSYPISYAQFQFVSNKEDIKPISPLESSSSGGRRLKNRRRASAPSDQLRGSLPGSPDSPSGSKSKTPTVFKKLRSTFRKKNEEQGK